MNQLILTILAIALTAALAVVSIKYIPADLSISINMADSAEIELRDISNAYNFLTKEQDGEPPAVQASGDGGFNATFLPVIKFTPNTLKGYSWSYHKMGNIPNSVYSDMNFVCLSNVSTQSYTGITQKVLDRLKSRFPEGQLVLTTSACTSPLTGALSAAPTVGGSVPNIAFFLRYVPSATY